jgi:signal transduction histidine kinase
MESSEYTLERVEVDFVEFLREEIATAIPTMEERGYPYRIEIGDGPVAAAIDPKEMSRVLQNLFSNAMKYNPPGTRIDIDLKEGEGELVLTFADNGVGMPAEVAANVFRSFYRAEASRNSETGGTGLGLTIVDRVIRAHGGSIDLASEEGGGSIFTLRLPRV